MTTTNTCPAWCTWQDNQNHIEGDLLVAGDATLRTHALTVGEVSIAGRVLAVDVVQEEYVRGRTSEFGPVAVFLGEVEPTMTTPEARQLAALLVQAAERAEALR